MLKQASSGLRGMFLMTAQRQPLAMASPLATRSFFTYQRAFTSASASHGSGSNTNVVMRNLMMNYQMSRFHFMTRPQQFDNNMLARTMMRPSTLMTQSQAAEFSTKMRKVREKKLAGRRVKKYKLKTKKSVLKRFNVVSNFITQYYYECF